MKRLFMLTVLLMFCSSAFAWKDCNLPENEAACKQEFKEYLEKKAELQKQYSGTELNRKICEELGVCGGGGAGGAAGAGGGQ